MLSPTSKFARAFGLALLAVGLFPALPAGAVSSTNIDLVSRMTFSGGRYKAIRRDGALQRDYVGLGKTLVILSMTVPSAPSLLGWVDLGDDLMDVEVVGNYAYCAAYERGLVIVDISNPATPAIVGIADTPGRAFDVAVSGNHAYVADYLSGFATIDVTNKAAPVIVNTYLGASVGYSVAVSGGYLYAGASWPGVDVLSLANPAAPVYAGRWIKGSYQQAAEIVVAGGVAYLANRDDGLILLDLATPTAPTFLGRYDTPGIALSVSLVGTTAYVADYYTIQVIDVSTPSTPTLLGSRSNLSRPGGVVADGASVDVVDSVLGFARYDAADPNLPTIVGFYSAPGQSYAVAASGNMAYVLDSTRYFHFIDISNPAVPLRVQQMLLPKSPYYGLALSGDRAYTMSSDWQVDVVDIANPLAPLLLGFGYQPPPNYLAGIANCWPNVCIASNHGGLDIANLQNPYAPFRVGVYDTPGFAFDVAIDGGRAYLADGDALRILDISDPTDPKLAGTLPFAGSSNVSGIAVANGIAYVCEGLVGLRIVDVSNPALPVLLSTHPLPGAQQVAVSGKWAYVAAGSDGLVILDVSNPAAPTPAGQFDTDGVTTAVALVHGYALLTDFYSGSYLVHFNGQCLDPFEANDRLDAAARALPGTFSSKICTPGDPDFYYVDVASSGLLDLDVTAASGVATVVDLFSATRAPLATASAPGGGSARIRIAASPGRHFFRIAGQGAGDFSATNSYSVNLTTIPSGSCTAPTLPVTIASMTKPGGVPRLTITDPNPGASTTGTNLYRATSPSGPFLLLGGNSADEEGAAPGIQITDPGGTAPTLFYEAKAVNIGCPVEGP